MFMAGFSRQMGYGRRTGDRFVTSWAEWIRTALNCKSTVGDKKRRKEEAQFQDFAKIYIEGTTGTF
jgi:hypothetical protein